MEIDKLYQLFSECAGVVTDTRKELNNKIFFALKGDRFNGNHYASNAIKDGALLAIVDEEEYKIDDQYILVEDVLMTLQALASYHRKVLGLPIIGITGTNGKTTNKELLGNVLSRKFNCYYTKGNLNNHIGVPLSLLEMRKEHEIAIIEMGANRLGDIQELCEITDPDYGYITNIGIAHLEGFKSRENIVEEKGKLFEYVRQKGGAFFVNSSDEILLNLTHGYEHRILIGEKSSDEYRFKLEKSIPVIEFSDSHHYKYTSKLYGEHNYENLKMVCGIAQYFKVEKPEIKIAFEDYAPKNNRSQVVKYKGAYFFLDAYNANPSSMRKSIESFAQFDSNEKVLILGDMLELGENTEQYHYEILELIAQSDWQKVILIGRHFGLFAQKYNLFHFFNDTSSANAIINQLLKEGRYFLLKGSRGQALEKLEIIQQMI